jgi:Homeodomain-like domain
MVGSYKLLERLQTKHEIYRMILQGHTYQKIMDELHISERTFYRHLDIIFSEEKAFLEDNIIVNGRQELKRQFIISRDRLLEQRRDLIEMTKDPNVKDEVKISAHHLIAEISAAVLRIYAEGPAVVAQTHTFLGIL